MPARALFITGTDTGVGKTRASVALLGFARSIGIDAVGFKPVASGCELSADGWRNDDALQLAAAGDHVEPYERINPYALPEAIAPHLAARAAGVRIERAVLDAAFDALAARHELVIVEGAGGWRVPLAEPSAGAGWEFADWVAARGWPVVLVVALRLGCLNHASLSAESIRRRAPLAGWIANRLPPTQPYWQDNLAVLDAQLAAPRLGLLPESGGVEVNMAALDQARLADVLRA